MTMRTFRNAAAALIATAALGCGPDPGSGALTDPSKIQPLSDEQQAELKKFDDAITAEESTAGGVVPKKGGAGRKNGR